MRRAAIAMTVLVALARAGLAQPQPRIDDATGVEVHDQDSRSATADRRPVYVAGGVAVLAVIFMWNRRRRRELDRRSEDETRRLRAEARSARAANPPDSEPDAPAPPNLDGDDPDDADLREAARSTDPSDQEPT